MPSGLHEVLIEMFRQRPSLAADLLTGGLGLEVPAHDRAEIRSADSTDLVPTEYRADAVVVLSAGRKAVLAVVVEVQLRRDADKRWSWPVYVTTLRGRFRCPTVLLVVCADAATAGWCATRIELGPGSVLTPMVLGPDRVPVVSDAVAAVRDPELAVLSALAHGGDPARSGVLNALLSSLVTVEPDLARLYYDLVFAALPEAARRCLEDLVRIPTYRYQSDFARGYFSDGKAEGVAEGLVEGRAEGRAEGKAVGRAEGAAVGRAEGAVDGLAGAVLAVLEARGIDVPAEARTRIVECGSLDRLDLWVRRAVTVDAVGDLFPEE